MPSVTDIFISYRREDAESDAWRLYEDLQVRISDQIVFMDREKIPPGQDFRIALKEHLASAHAVLVLIGPKWLEVANKSTGQRRLDEEGDFVRYEIATALSQQKLVIPVLLPGARIPKPEELPEAIRELAYCNAFELAHKFWSHYVDELIARLRGEEPARPGAGLPRPTWKTVFLLVALAVSLLTGLHVFSVFNLPFDPQFPLAALALVLGFHAGRPGLSPLRVAAIAACISTMTGLLTSAVIGMMFNQSILPGNPLEFRLLAVFIGILFVAYMVGALLKPAFHTANRSGRSRI